MLVASFHTPPTRTDLLDYLQSSAMAKQSNDVTLQNDGTLPSSTKGNKFGPSRNSNGSSRLSHLLSKISRKDKKIPNNYYIPAEPPFTSTPDMSGEEDAVEVSYIETESENNGDSEDTIPAADSANTKSSLSRVIYVDSAVMDDSTTTTTASADYSSSSAFGNTNTEEQMIRTSITACTTSDQQVVQPIAQTKLATADDNANFRSCLRKMWSSMMCDIAEVIDGWLPLDLSQMIKCSDNSDTFFERLHHEAEVFVTFLIAQFRFIPTIWSSLIWPAFIQLYEEWLQKTVQNAKENLNEYYETVWTNVVRKYYMILIRMIN
ncbi:unnamed protein product [Acanthocheilonema viteae]|uniref:Uncharacterized protein n=1 Tax=Acanthocheilonema viteae TaxID=6277 RepID=A0A498S6B0_ACAVI|nr:unnamed protein product [Acanthocheilonema viteae]